MGVFSFDIDNNSNFYIISSEIFGTRAMLFQSLDFGSPINPRTKVKMDRELDKALN